MSAYGSAPDSGTQPLLDVKGLSVVLGGASIVENLGFELAAGQCVAIVGESGAGKSMTGRALLGLLPERATARAERVQLEGRELYPAGSPQREREWLSVRGREIALVSQDALVSLDPLRSVGAEVGEPLVVHGLAQRGRELNEQVTGLVARVHVPEPERRAKQYPHQLSGGLRQRALIASGLAAHPKVLIADEPTTALDATVQARILELLGEIKEQGAGIVLISHDLHVVARLADHVIVMKSGRVVEQGPASAVLSAPAHPYTRELLAAHPDGQPLLAEQRVVQDRVVLRGTGITAKFPLPGGGSVTAANGVDITVRAGETVGLVGESGSGKSTIMRILLGLHRPSAGEVLFHGEPWNSATGGVSEHSRRARRHDIQVVAQDAHSAMNKRWSVQRIIAEGLEPSEFKDLQLGDRARSRTARVLELMASVGLEPGLAGRRPSELSGGQRQRVAIARALAARPTLLLCDEPVSALDVTVQAQVIGLLADLQARTGISMVFISHDLAVVGQLAHTIVVLKDGDVVETGPAHQVLTWPEHEYTRELLASSVG